MIDFRHAPQRAYQVFDLIDYYARRRLVHAELEDSRYDPDPAKASELQKFGAPPRPMSDVQFFIDGEFKNGNFYRFQDPWELIVKQNRSGHILFFGIVRTNSNVRQKLNTGQYRLRIEGHQYQPITLECKVEQESSGLSLFPTGERFKESRGPALPLTLYLYPKSNYPVNSRGGLLMIYCSTKNSNNQPISCPITVFHKYQKQMGQGTVTYIPQNLPFDSGSAASWLSVSPKSASNSDALGNLLVEIKLPNEDIQLTGAVISQDGSRLADVVVKALETSWKPLPGKLGVYAEDKPSTFIERSSKSGANGQWEMELTKSKRNASGSVTLAFSLEK